MSRQSLLIFRSVGQRSKSLMRRWPVLIFRSVGERSSLFLICWGRGISVSQTYIFKFGCLWQTPLSSDNANLELLPFVQKSFSRLFFTMLSGIRMKVCSNLPYEELRSSSTFVMVDPLFHELLFFVQKPFAELFFAMLSDIGMKVGSKLLYRSSLNH